MAYRIGIQDFTGPAWLRTEIAGRVLGFSSIPHAGERICIQLDSPKGEVNVVFPVQSVTLAALPNRHQMDGWLTLGDPESVRNLDMTAL